MKKATAILLSACLLLQCCAGLGVLGLYRLNKAYIAANLCENRAKRDSSCAGQCYLRKQLKKVDDSESPAKHNAPKKEVQETTLFFAKADFSTPAFPAIRCPSPRTPTLQHLRDTRTAADIFHPPAGMA